MATSRQGSSRSDDSNRQGQQGGKTQQDRSNPSNQERNESGRFEANRGNQPQRSGSENRIPAGSQSTPGSKGRRGMEEEEE